MTEPGGKGERRLVLLAHLEGYFVALCWGVLWGGVVVALLGLLLPERVALIVQALVVASAITTFFGRCSLVNHAIRKYRHGKSLMHW